jgi:tRNA/tmRNA/rRNA uracil-C5-methylase (TrmA/RlmC/RlmD family)
LAVEINDKLVKLGKDNFELNNISNVEILACDSSDFARKVLGKTVFELREKKTKGRRPTTAATRDTKEEQTNGEQQQLQNVKEKNLIYEFKTVLVDPPRLGLDQRTIRVVQQYDNIIYISCFPPKLLEDISQVIMTKLCFLILFPFYYFSISYSTQLQSTHKVTQLGIFDHFAYTNHLEVGVLLQKLNGDSCNEFENGH